MSELIVCTQCQSENCYNDGTMNICIECGAEWSADAGETTNGANRDGNGTELFDGDAVTVIKDLKVKGSSMVVKRGTKVKNIRLTATAGEVDCKVEGISIVLKTCFLKK